VYVTIDKYAELKVCREFKRSFLFLEPSMFGIRKNAGFFHPAFSGIQKECEKWKV
jgi:hypothetical protein